MHTSDINPNVHCNAEKITQLLRQASICLPLAACMQVFAQTKRPRDAQRLKGTQLLTTAASSLQRCRQAISRGLMVQVRT